MFCPACGLAVPDASRFCLHCAKELDTTTHSPPPKETLKSQISFWGSLVSIITAWPVAHAWASAVMSPSSVQTQSLSGMARLQAVIVIGIVAAALHGIIWQIINKRSGWRYGEAERLMPKGWAAATLSATMTVPLVVCPLIYQKLTGVKLVPDGYLIPAVSVVVGSALGHILLYGSDLGRIEGFRNTVFPVGSPARWSIALEMEAIYALVHFFSVVFVFRVALALVLGRPNAIFFPTLISAILWLSGVCVFLFLTYPRSLEDEKWVEVRGIIHGLMLTIALQGGMFM